jgi:hypothetical protein
MVSFTPLPLYPRGVPGTHWIGWLGLRAGLDDIGAEKNLPLQGIERRPSSPVARLYTELSRLLSAARAEFNNCKACRWLEKCARIL